MSSSRYEALSDEQWAGERDMQAGAVVMAAFPDGYDEQTDSDDCFEQDRWGRKWEEAILWGLVEE